MDSVHLLSGVFLFKSVLVKYEDNDDGRPWADLKLSRSWIVRRNMTWLLSRDRISEDLRGISLANIPLCFETASRVERTENLLLGLVDRRQTKGIG